MHIAIVACVSVTDTSNPADHDMESLDEAVSSWESTDFLKSSELATLAPTHLELLVPMRAVHGAPSRLRRKASNSCGGSNIELRDVPNIESNWPSVDVESPPDRR